jgi:hypothetical protein
MCAALRRSDYYETSVPPRGLRSATNLPAARLEARRVGRPEEVPTFTTRSIGQGGAQLYSGSFTAATPQTFTTVTRPLPEGIDGETAPPQNRSRALRPAQIHQIRAGTTLTELQPLVHSRYTF